MHERKETLAQVEDHSDRHGVPAVSVDITHVHHLYILAVLLPNLYFFLAVQQVLIVLYFFDQDGMAVWNIVAWIEDGLILFAQLLYVRVFLFCESFYQLLIYYGHGQRNGVDVENGYLDHQFVLSPMKIPLKRNDKICWRGTSYIRRELLRKPEWRKGSFTVLRHTI